MRKKRFTDLGNARRLAARFRGRLKYVPSWGWLFWEGTHWSRDTTGTIERCAKHVVEAMFIRASHLKNKGVAAALKKHARSSESNTGLKAMINLARTENTLVATPEQFDTDALLLNCLNGTLNLRTGRVRKHRRQDMITQIAPVDYDPGAKCPRWDDFLDRITSGNTELISYLQRIAGYSLTGETSEQCLFVLHGEGANGKSVFIEAIMALLGDYAARTPTETLMVRPAGTIRNDLARLVYRPENTRRHLGRFLTTSFVALLRKTPGIAASRASLVIETHPQLTTGTSRTAH